MSPASFDCILSVRVFHYLEHFPDLASRLYQWLAPGGSLIFSVEHPLKYANSRGDWIVDAEGNASAWPIDSYLKPGPRPEERMGVHLVKWHRPISAYITPLIEAGFLIKAVMEPDFTDEGWRDQPAAAEGNRRRPNILVIRADKEMSTGTA
nr:methyltransferase domain-containing protein [Sulfobacillus harzensis]